MFKDKPKETAYYLAVICQENCGNARFLAHRSVPVAIYFDSGLTLVSSHRLLDVILSAHFSDLLLSNLFRCSIVSVARRFETHKRTETRVPDSHGCLRLNTSRFLWGRRGTRPCYLHGESIVASLSASTSGFWNSLAMTSIWVSLLAGEPPPSPPPPPSPRPPPPRSWKKPATPQKLQPRWAPPRGTVNCGPGKSSRSHSASWAPESFSFFEIRPRWWAR